MWVLQDEYARCEYHVALDLKSDLYLWFVNAVASHVDSYPAEPEITDHDLQSAERMNEIIERLKYKIAQMIIGRNPDSQGCDSQAVFGLVQCVLDSLPNLKCHIK